MGNLSPVGSAASADTLFSLYRLVGPTSGSGSASVFLVATDLASGVPLWETLYATDPERLEIPFDVVAAPDGSAAFVLSQVEAQTAAVVLRFDALDGTPTLLVSDGGPSGSGATGRALAVSPTTGEVLFLRGYGGDSALSALDPFTGVELWSKIRAGAAPQALRTGPAGIYTVETENGQELVVSAHDPSDGSELWENRPGFGLVLGSAVSADGSLFAVSNVPLPFGGPAAPGGTLAFETSTGDLIWSAPDYGRLAVSDDGSRLFRARDLPVNAGIETSSLDGATGAVQWQEEFTSGTLPRLQDLVTHSASGSLSLAMTTDSTVTGPIALVLDYDVATGSLMWLQFADVQSELFLDYGAGGTRLLASGSTPELQSDGTTPQVARQIAYQVLSGLETWDRSAMEMTGAVDRALAFELSPDGTQAFLSGSSANLGQALTLVAFDAQTGAEQWSVAEVSTGTVGDQDLVVAPDGASVFLSSHAGGEQRVLARSAVDGSELWSRSLPESSTNVTATGTADLGLTSDGGTLFVSYRRDPTGVPGQVGMAVFALDTSTGTTLWERFLDPGIASDTPHDLAVAPDDGSVVVVGRSGVPQVGRSMVAISLDASDGTDQWTSFGPPNQSDHGKVVQFSSDGTTVFVAANGSDEFDPRSHLVVAFDRVTGAELWASPVAVGVGVRDMTLSLDESQLIVTGSRFHVFQSQFKRDITTIAYDSSTGAEQWRSEHDEDPWQVAVSLDVGDDGNTVFVTGIGALGSSLTVGGGSTFLTFAYDLETGAELWTARFEIGFGALGGPAELAAGPGDGRLFVAGSDFYRDLSLFAYDIPDLVTDTETLSLASGGTVGLGLRPGLGSESDFYFLLGSASGTAPGVDLGGGLVLPLEPDAYFFVTLAAKASALGGFQGSFDARGIAGATLTVPAASDPALAGTTLHHAFLAADVLGFPDAVSNAVAVVLEP